MDAKTVRTQKKAERTMHLCASLIGLIVAENRSQNQINKVIGAIQRFIHDSDHEEVARMSSELMRVINSGKRTDQEIDNVIQALQEFKDAPSTKPEVQEDLGPDYPGRFGNRCRRCGSWIDEGGHCNCGTYHGSLF